jgi:nucleoside-diphosphate-sugar epimerase
MRIKDARQTFLGIWIKLLIEDKPFEIWEGQQLRDFNYVDDAVDAFLVAAECEKADGQIFNLGGDEPISLHNLGNMLVNINGKGEFITKKFPAERKRIDIGDYYSDYSKIKKELGWTPKILLREGLTHTIEYYQKYHQQYR